MRARSLAMVVVAAVWFTSGGSAIAAPASPAVYVEDSPAAQEIVDEALALREQGRLAEAAERLQRVIREYPHKLMRTGDGLYRDALLWVRSRLIEDAELLASYQQVFEAEAERELGQAMAVLVDAEALERVVAHYALTAPGLEAGLALVAVYLERADARSAASVLDELADHPDLAAHRGRYHYLQAVAGLLSGDTRRLHHHHEQLVDAGFSADAASIEALENRLHPPLRLARLGDGEPVAAGELPESLEDPLWEVPVTWSPLGEDGSLGRRVARRDEGPPALPIIPTAGGQQLYLNEGDRVRALDRSSGWTRWSYDWQAATEQADVPIIARKRSGTPDDRGVLVHGERLFTIVGESSIWPSRWARDISATALVCLDRQDGALQWEVEPAELDPTLGKAYFVGTPIAADDHVVALLRRSQMANFQDTFVVAVDRHTGELRWRRHLASAAMTNRYAAGPSPRMSSRGATIYASDPLGAVAAIDARTGTAAWVHVLADQIQDPERVAARTKEEPEVPSFAPVPCAAGLIVGCAGEQGPRVLLLDPTTGERQAELTGTAWRTASDVLPAGEDVLVLGPTVTLIDGTSLEVEWSRRLLEGDQAPLGHAAVTRGLAGLATADRLFLLNLRDGTVLRETPIDGPGNLLVFDGQVVLTTRDRVRSYMSWAQAQAQLREQIEAAPTNPDPGLALAHLALRAGHEDAVIEGVDRALAALRRQPGHQPPDAIEAAHRHVFRHLLTFVTPDSAASTELRRQLFDRLATTTAGPSQEVAYHLTFAGFLESVDEPARAVEHLQAVLMDPTLSSQLYEQQPVSRQAGLEARQRLESLVEEHGRTIYESYERMAAHRLSELSQQRAEPAAWVALAAQYPLSSSAPMALLVAAEQLAGQGDVAAAARHLRRAYPQAVSQAPQVLPQLAGDLASLYARSGQPRRAVAWLRHVHEEHPDLLPQRDGQPVPIDVWIAELSQMQGAVAALPALGLPLGRPVLLDGRLLTPGHSGVLARAAAGSTDATGGPGTSALSGLITQVGHHVRLYDGPQLTQRWQIKLEHDDLEALAASEEQVLLWSPEDEQLLALNARDGELMWSAVEATAVLAEVGDPDRRRADQSREHRQFLQMVKVAPLRVQGGRVVVEQHEPAEGVMIAVGERAVAIADHAGRVVGIDRDTGQVLWRLLTPMEDLARVAAQRDTLALAGVVGVGTDAESAALMVLDLVTGEPRLPTIEDKERAQWLGFAGESLIVTATADQVTAYDLHDGAVAWRMTVPDSPLTGEGWADEQLVMLLDNAGVGLVIDSSRGEVLNRLSLEEPGGGAVIEAAPIEHHWHVLTPRALRAIDSQGQIAWEDAITAPEQRRIAQVPTRQYVALLAEESPRAAADDDEAVQLRQLGLALPDNGARPARPREPDHDADADRSSHVYQLYLLDRRSGALVAEHPLGPLPAAIDPTGATAREHCLVLPLGDQTLVIPDRQGRTDR